METNQNKWWGYRHVSGTLQVKRYFDSLDTEEARDSEFCEIVRGPFMATDRDDAIAKLKALIE